MSEEREKKIHGEDEDHGDVGGDGDGDGDGEEGGRKVQRRLSAADGELKRRRVSGGAGEATSPPPILIPEHVHAHERPVDNVKVNATAAERPCRALRRDLSLNMPRHARNRAPSLKLSPNHHHSPSHDQNRNPNHHRAVADRVCE
uniref:Uncharacterized protein n=1 Tax=Psilocybe cubensis TaxID=181762 RepID=A0A8H7XK00_PSICU